MQNKKYLQENRLLILLIKKRNQSETLFARQLLFSKLNWQYILEAAKAEGIFYPVYQELLVLDAKYGFLSQGIGDGFKQFYYAYISQSVVFSDQISRILADIEENGIKTLLLKGASIDALIYKEDFSRPRSDLDLVVRNEDFPALEKLLVDSGYSFPGEEKNYPLPEYLNSRMYCKEGAVSVHLHRHIINNLYLMVVALRVDIKRVWQETERFKNYNYIFCLKPGLQILYLCEHALKHNFTQWIYMYEISGLLDRYRGELDWKELVALSGEFNLSPALYYGLYFTDQVLSSEIPEYILQALKPKKLTFLEKFFIKCTLEKKRIAYLSYVVYLSVQKGLFKKIRFLFKTIFPPKFTLLGNLARLRRLARLIVIGP